MHGFFSLHHYMDSICCRILHSKAWTPTMTHNLYLDKDIVKFKNLKMTEFTFLEHSHQGSQNF